MVDYSKELFVKDHILTNSGIYFDAFNPDPSKIIIEDLAHALSQQPRFGGHLPKFYSVAQHCLYCARIAPPHLKLCMLLHDASEAYLCDIPSPFKSQMPEYKKAEGKLMEVILARFGILRLYKDNEAEIKDIDTQALKDEWDFLMKGRPCTNPLFPVREGDMLPMAKVKELFLAKFKCYYNPEPTNQCAPNDCHYPNCNCTTAFNV